MDVAGVNMSPEELDLAASKLYDFELNEWDMQRVWWWELSPVKQEVYRQRITHAGVGEWQTRKV